MSYIVSCSSITNSMVTVYKVESTFWTYLYIVKLSNIMERLRHTNDIEHPMYGIIDNVLSSIDGCG